MHKSFKRIASCAIAGVGLCAFVPMAFSQTTTSTGGQTEPGNGPDTPFTSVGPLTSAFLSVDINGGIISSNNTSTEGTTGPSSSPTIRPDAYGVTWSPWGGPVSTSGDGTQLPNSNGGAGNANSIAKTFGGLTATLSTPGVAANYAQNGTGALNGRDRGVPPGDPANSPTVPAGDGDMFRDFEFAGINSGQTTVQSENYLQLTLTGLTPGGQYQVELYSYDQSSNNTTCWSGSPLLDPGVGDINATTGAFTAPADEQIISWNSTWVRGGIPSGGSQLAPQPGALFTETADNTGTVTFYGWGGDGLTGNANSQSATSSYLDGFQIAVVPEPASISLVAVGALGLLSRRRKA
jgi:hypothetical protein